MDIHRSAIGGFALIEQPWDQTSRELCLLIRYRRDLVRQTSRLACQIREHLEASWPGYAANFYNLWLSEVAWEFFRQFEAPDDILAAGVQGLRDRLRQAHVRFQRETVERVLSWARTAPAGECEAILHRRIVLALLADPISYMAVLLTRVPPVVATQCLKAPCENSLHPTQPT
jgi:hypothetical protein